MEIDGAIERILEKAGIEPAVARYAIVFTTETEGGIESAVVKGSHVVGVFRTSDEDMDVFEADFQQELAKTAWVKYDLQPFTDLAEISPEDLMALVTDDKDTRSEEHTSELQSLMRISYAVFCLKKKTSTNYVIIIST